MSTELRTQIAETLSLVLEQAVETDADFDFKTAGVDSVKMLDIVMALEDTFDIRFSPQQMPKLSSLNATEEVVSQLVRK